MSRLAFLRHTNSPACHIVHQQDRSYERHVDFARTFGNIKGAPTEVRVGVSVREEVEIVNLEDSLRARTPSKALGGELGDEDISDLRPESEVDIGCDRKVAPV